MTYTDVFGSATLPPAEYGYASFTLTTNATFVWPYNTDGSPYPVAKVMDIACDAGNEVTLPDCTEVSTGEDFLIRNVGANVLTVKDAAGVQVASVAVGAASYFYLTDNTSAAGVFGVIGFGVGTSTADASSLVGYGIKAVGASLNQAHPVQPTNTGITLSADHRAKLVVFTGGVATFALDSAATLGDDYFTMFRNDGTGTATIDPAASELIDGMASMQVQPGESLMLICTGTKWYSVGYGRSTLYQFTQLTKDVSAGGTITLSATEAANKLITFIGNPSAAVEVVVPAVVAVYYTQSAISTAQTITLKTSAGSGVGISQGARVIALCDGTNVVSAQSAVANTSVSLTDGSALVPSLFFATQTNTGLFKSGTRDVGVTVNGSTVGVFGSTGLQTATIGPNSTQRHTLPAVPSDTVTLNTATQTLTNKTLSSPIISSPTGITKTDVGLGNVDNTSDANKPVSTAQQSALNLKLNTSGGTITANSSSAALTITQTGTGNALVVEDAASDTTPFVIDPSGKVIVGHTAAVTGAYGDYATLLNIGTGFIARQFNHSYSADSFAPVVEFGKSRSATAGAHTVVTSDDELGTLRFAGSDGTAFKEAARIQAVVDGTPGTNDMPGRLVFSTTPDGSASPVERMRIDSAGKTKFTGGVVSGEVVRVSNSTADSYLIIDQADASATNMARPVISLRKQNVPSFQISADGGAANLGVTYYEAFTATGQHAFYTNDAERMRIDSAGNVGIGSAPKARLQVTAAANLNAPVLGSATNAPFYVTNSDASYGLLVGTNAADGSAWMQVQRTDGTATAYDLRLQPAGGNTLHVGSNGGLGYGTGAGGTVTQATSKSTPVTLNKPTGQITMHNEALAAGASVSFTLNNSLIGVADVVVLSPCGGFSVSGNYSLRIGNTQNGAVSIFVKNESAGSLSEAVIINFVIIRGATA